MGHASAGAVDLAAPGFAPKVSGDFKDVGQPGRTEWVPLGNESARRIDRDPSVSPRRAGIEEVRGFAGSAQLKILVVQELSGGETIMQLDQIEIGRSNPRALIGAFGGKGAESVEVGCGF